MSGASSDRWQQMLVETSWHKETEQRLCVGHQTARKGNYKDGCTQKQERKDSSNTVYLLPDEFEAMQ